MRSKLAFTSVHDKAMTCPRCGKTNSPMIAIGITTWEDWGDEFNSFDKPRLICSHCDKFLGELSDSSE